MVLSQSGCLYPEGGGQPGDRGRLCAADGKLLVYTALHAYKRPSGYVCDASFLRYESDMHVHQGSCLCPPLARQEVPSIKRCHLLIWEYTVNTNVPL